MTISDEGWARVLASHREYHAETAQAYDEVLHEVVQRVEKSGDIGKADIGALVLWERLRRTHPGLLT